MDKADMRMQTTSPAHRDVTNAAPEVDRFPVFQCIWLQRPEVSSVAVTQKQRAEFTLRG